MKKYLIQFNNFLAFRKNSFNSGFFFCFLGTFLDNLSSLFFHGPIIQIFLFSKFAPIKFPKLPPRWHENSLINEIVKQIDIPLEN